MVLSNCRGLAEVFRLPDARIKFRVAIGFSAQAEESRALKRLVRPRLATEQGKESAWNSDRITSAGEPSLSHDAKIRTKSLFAFQQIQVVFLLIIIMLCENSIDKTSNHTQKHLRLQKLNNIKKMDKQIRKNWGEMFRHKKILINQNPEQQITKIRHLTTETTQLRVHKSHSNHRHIQKLKSQLKRQQTHERQKKNEEIFFKKRTYDIKNGLARSISTEKSICRFKTEQKQQKSKFSTQKALGNQQKRKLLFDIPFMLKKRTEKIQKQLNRIQSNYQKNLLRIKSKQDLKTAQAIYSQKKMIKKIKGTKIFYQMIREWKPSDQYLQK